jgi:DNA processing protein
VSGLAFGIDAQAHKSALENQLQTIAVLGHGLDRIYPGQHTKLAERMLANNAGLITEFMSGTLPDRENFPKRNRIVAGLVDAVLVVESPVKGGSIITANLAFDYDREVMAIPGCLGDELARGGNLLIKQNKAHLVENAEDIMHIMNWQVCESVKPKIKAPLQLTMEEELIFAALKDEALHIDQLQRHTGLQSGTLSMLLLQLEFKKLVRALPGKRFERV